jgi:quercetin dioxygenase-like cupin family protein
MSRRDSLCLPIGIHGYIISPENIYSGSGHKKMTEVLYKARPVAIKEAIEYAADSVVSKMLIKKETGNLTLFAFDEGQALSEHTAPFDAAVLILEGKAEIVIGGESFILGEGDFVTMPANTPHDVKATEKMKMLLIMIKEKKS